MALSVVWTALLVAVVGVSLVRCQDGREARAAHWGPYQNLDPSDRKLVRRAIRRGSPPADALLAAVATEYATGSLAGRCHWQTAASALVLFGVASGAVVAAVRGDAVNLAIRGGILAVIIPIRLYVSVWMWQCKRFLGRS